MKSTIDIDQIANVLRGKRTLKGWQCHCPAHDDKNPSLSLGVGSNGQPVWHCHAGCSSESVRSALERKGLMYGLRDESPKKRKIQESEFIYLSDPELKPAQRVLRIDFSDGSKTFPCFRLENEKWVSGKYQGSLYPFKYDQWRDENKIVFFVEGERKCLSLIERGFKATCIPGGAGAWRESHSKYFVGRSIVILNDNDEPGRKFSVSAYRDLKKVAASVIIVELPGLGPKEDIADWWLKPGGSPKKLKELVQNPPALSEEIINLMSSPDPISVEFDDKLNGEDDCASTNNDGGPLPLFRNLPPPDNYPLDQLGDILGPAAKCLFNNIQAPDGICAQSILGGAALAVQGHRNLRIDGREYPTSLFLLSVANSGERKSGTDSEALAPHRAYERQMYTKYQDDFSKYENDLMAYESQKKFALTKARSLSDKKNALSALLSDRPIRPLFPITIFEEPSYEGLVKLYQIGQPSMGLFTDEGGRLVGGYAMSEDNQVKTATGLSSLWDGKRIDRVRSGDGAFLAFGKRLSMHVMVQPVIAHQLLGNRIFREQGFLPRFLISWPDPMAGKRTYMTTDLSQEVEIKKYHSRIKEILETACPCETGKPYELKPKPIELNSAAKSLWMKFDKTIESQLGDEGNLATIRPFASKSGQHALRIAATLAAIEDLDTVVIDLDKMAQGIELTQYYLGEYLRLSNTSNDNPDLQLAQRLLNWAQQSNQGGKIYLQKVYQCGPNSIRDAKTAKRIVGILEEHKWLIRVEGGEEIDGSHRRDVWSVVK